MFSRTLVPIVFAAVAAAATVKIPRELYERTGLSDAQIRSLVAPLDVRALDCPANMTDGGVFPGPGTPTIQALLERNSFVTRQGTKLKLLGKDFRMVGTNIYWLGLDENVIPDPAYPSKTRILEALADVSVMHGTTVRGHTLGVSVGNPLSVEPSLDVFNNGAYESIDFAILAARLYGIKLLIPLVDNYNYYHGGKYQFIGWAGHNFTGTGSNIIPADVGAFFYNDTKVVDSFKRYITQHLNHVNQYTGIALKDDPTILGWESGNELAAVLFGDGPAPPAWTKEIGQLVKSLAPRQLSTSKYGSSGRPDWLTRPYGSAVKQKRGLHNIDLAWGKSSMDGSYGIYPDSGQLDTKEVDIFGDHFYPPNITKLTTGMDLVNKAGRNYFAGEFDWTENNAESDPLDEFLSVITKSPGAGDAFWSLFGHDDECCQYVEHDDGESFYYLRENDTVPYISGGQILIEHAAEITGQRKPPKFPAVACPQYKFSPSLLPIDLGIDFGLGIHL